MTAVPDAWTPPDDYDEPAPGLGLGYVLLLVVVGLLLLLAVCGAIWAFLDVLKAFTDNL